MTYVASETCMLIDMGLSQSECASWVQAWGAIAAILVSTLVAVFVAGKQARDALQLEVSRQQREVESSRLNAARYLLAIKAVATRVGFYCKTMEDAWSTFKPENHAQIFQTRDFLEFSEYKMLVQSFSLVEMPLPELIGEMSNLASYLDRATRAVEQANTEIRSKQPLNPGLWPTLQRQLKDAHDSADLVVDICMNGLRSLDRREIYQGTQ